jgi:anti-sigma regulatory factor (Ser/Thr protein kinase)
VSEQNASIEAAACVDGIVALADWAETRAAAAGADNPAFIRLCVEEATTNIFMHGFDDDPSRHRIRLEVEAADGGVRCTIVDDGRPFDPASARDPESAANIDEVRIGGRGIPLMRKFSKSIRYERRDGLNRLVLTF